MVKQPDFEKMDAENSKRKRMQDNVRQMYEALKAVYEALRTGYIANDCAAADRLRLKLENQTKEVLDAIEGGE